MTNQKKWQPRSPAETVADMEKRRKQFDFAATVLLPIYFHFTDKTIKNRVGYPSGLTALFDAIVTPYQGVVADLKKQLARVEAERLELARALLAHDMPNTQEAAAKRVTIKRRARLLVVESEHGRA